MKYLVNVCYEFWILDDGQEEDFDEMAVEALVDQALPNIHHPQGAGNTIHPDITVESIPD